MLFEQNRKRWGSKVIVFNVVNKWASAEGKRFVVVHTRSDCWATIEGEFVLRR